MNFKDFHDYAKSMKPLVKQATKIDSKKLIEELKAAHPEHEDELDTIHKCFLDFLVIHSHLYDLANDAVQIERNYRELQQKG